MTNNISRSQDALREYAERFRDLTASTSDIIWELDAELRYTYIDPKIKDVLGYEPEELIGKKSTEFNYSESRALVKEQLDDFIKSQQSITRWENAMMHKDGHPVLMETSAVPFFDNEGNLRGYRGIDRDITERKQAEFALLWSEERFRNLTESTSDIIWELDADGNYTYVNPKVKDILGYEPNEMIGRSAYDFNVPYGGTGDPRERLRDLLKSRKPFVGWENAVPCKDGKSVVIVETNGVPFFDNDGKLLGYRGIDRDITERIQLVADREHYRHQGLRMQEQERKRIARELHDDAAQSLVSLSVEIGKILMVIEKDPKVASRQLESARKRITGIVEDIRCFCHALRPGLIDKFGLVPAINLLAEELRNQYHLICKIEVSGEVTRLDSDSELHLYRIVQEALSNVIKHSNAKEALVRVEYRTDRIKVSISDNGDGFYVPEAISSFVRSKRLGLMNIRERTELLTGILSIESVKGKGTTVSIEIPICPEGTTENN